MRHRAEEMLKRIFSEKEEEKEAETVTEAVQGENEEKEKEAKGCEPESSEGTAPAASLEALEGQLRLVFKKEGA